MKHLNFKKIISSLFIGSSILVPSILSSCSNVKIDAEIAKHDENGWKNTVEELSNTKIPTIFFNVGGSFQIYQNTLMVLSVDSLAKQKKVILIKMKNISLLIEYQSLLLIYINIKLKLHLLYMHITMVNMFQIMTFLQMVLIKLITC